MKQLTTLLIGGCLWLGGQTADAKVFYMTPTGTASGASWQEAASDLSSVMEQAAPGDEIWMAGGDYTVSRTIYVKEGVDIYGGFAPGATSVDERKHDAEQPWLFEQATTLKGVGDPAMRLFDRADKTAIWQTETYIDGLTVSGHVTTNGRVAYFKEKMNLRNCRFLDCGAGSSVTYFEDGGSVVGCQYLGTLSGNSVDLRRVKPTADPVLVDHVEIAHTQACALAYYSTLAAGETNPDELDGLSAGTIRRVWIHDCHVPVPANYNPSSDNGTSAGMAVTHTLTRGLTIADVLVERCSISTMGGTALLCKYTGSTRLTRSVFRNNENRSDVSVVTKPAAILYAENGLTMTSCLVNNNTTPELCNYLMGGSYLNNTWAHNEGGTYLTQAYAAMVNNLMTGNRQKGAPANIKADNAYYSSFYYNALDKDIQFIVPVGGNASAPNTSDTDGCFVLTEEVTFAKPTTFVGAAADEAQAAELETTDWSLNPASTCVNAGSVSYLQDWTHSYLTNEPVPWFDDIYATDLGGNSRQTADGISLGAYEGKAADAIGHTKTHPVLLGTDGRTLTLQMPAAGRVRLYTTAGVPVGDWRLAPGHQAIGLAEGGVLIADIQCGTERLRQVIVIR